MILLLKDQKTAAFGSSYGGGWGQNKESAVLATVLVEGIQPGLTLAMTEEPEAGLSEPTGEVLLSADI